MGILKKSMLGVSASALTLALGSAAALAGDVAGTVTNPQTGNVLMGASVRVEETGASTTTDSRGRYQLAGLAAGSYTLSITSINGDSQQVVVTVPATGVVTQDVELTPADVIVVRGYAGSVLQSLEDKRNNSFVSDVIRADDMGNLPNANLTEALARLPGLNAVRSQTTGEGDRITVRGLSTEYNNYSMNGVTLGGVGSPDDNFFRGVRLSFLSPEGIDQITVRKTIQPDMDGDAIGGTIDIQTPTAFDYEDRHFGISAEGRMQDKFDNDKSHSISASFADRFGDHVGIFVTGFHEISRSQYEEVGDHGDHQPNTWYSNSRSGIDGWDYGSFQVPGWELSRGSTEVERYGFNGSLDFQFGHHEFHVRGQYNEYQETRDNNIIHLRNRSDSALSNRFSQVDTSFKGLPNPDTWDVIGFDNAKGAIYGRQNGASWEGDVTLGQIKDVDNDGMITAADARCRTMYSLCGASGVWDPQDFRLSREWTASRNLGQAASLNFGGLSEFGNLTVEYELAYSSSEDNIDYGYEAVFQTRSGSAGNGQHWYGNEGFSISYSDPRFPYFNLNEAGHAALQDPASYDYDGVGAEKGDVSEKLYQGQVDFTYEFNHAFLRNVRWGGKVVQSDRTRTHAEPAFDDGPFEDAETYADFAPWFGADVADMFNGRYTGKYRLGQTLDTGKMVDAFGADFSSLDYDSSEEFDFKERTMAGYVMGEAWFNNTQVITGVRVEHTTYEVDSFIEDEVQEARFDEGEVDQPYRRNHSETSYTQVLPSIHVNHFFENGVIARGAIWTSYGRPSIERATRPLELAYEKKDPVTGDDIDNPLEWRLVGGSVGNPGLKATSTVNFDGSLEWYNGSTGAYSVAVFYKDISNFLIRGSSSVIRGGTSYDASQLNIEGDLDLGSNPIAPNFVISQASNGEDASIYGIELAARQNLHWLPGLFGNIGIGANATYQQSEASTGMSWHPEGYTLPFFETPELLVNAELYYSDEHWDAYLSYNYQSEFLEDYEDFNNNPYEQPYTFVDFSLKRSVGEFAEVSLEVQNIFDSHTYWYTFGKDSGGLRAYIENGRTISLGFNAHF
ncbi:TonB-dependent receptor [Woodsholea maritima]|uniref:TonB-dependent receptor n=1 Tax=Woodsholea maritima TaxID=240237 RepID=UPI00039C19BF|nr:TonB-dependent receptor [Woodsholea maritima]